MNIWWLIRMRRWATHPPSRRMIQTVFVVVGLALLLYGIERFIGWPDWATVERNPGSGRGWRP